MARWVRTWRRNLSPFRPLLGQLIFSGVFERHPDLKVVFAEGGASLGCGSLYSMDKICRSYYTILQAAASALAELLLAAAVLRDVHG